MQVFCDNVVFDFSVYVTKLDIIVEKFEKPTFSSDYLNVTYRLMYNDTSELRTTEGELEIELELAESPIDDGHGCSGYATKGTMKTKFFQGKAEFKMINILSNGFL